MTRIYEIGINKKDIREEGYLEKSFPSKHVAELYLKKLGYEQTDMPDYWRHPKLMSYCQVEVIGA